MNARVGALAAAFILAMAPWFAANVLAQDANQANAELGFEAGLSQAKFEALVDHSFYVNSDQGIVILDLVEVQGSQPSPKPPGPTSAQPTERFTITLVGPAQPMLPAAIYRLETRMAGNTDVYLEPLGTDGSRTRYRATFQLLR
jgi:hypothetical protein